MTRKIRLKNGERLQRPGKKFFEMFGGHTTPRQCGPCLNSRALGAPPVAQAVAWIYAAGAEGRKDKSSRRPVCREHLAAEGVDL